MDNNTPPTVVQPRRPRRASDLSQGAGAPRPQRYGRPQEDGLAAPPLLTMGEVEERIIRADDELAELTAIHMDLADMAAEAEADWKAHRDRIIQALVDKKDERTAADYREAVARNSTDPVTNKKGSLLYREYKKAEAAAESSARAMKAIEARINAFQTVAANLRRVAT